MRSLATFLVAWLRRLKHGLRALSPRLHDLLMAAYRRTGGLHARLETAKLQRRIDDLEVLVQGAADQRRIEPAVAVRLQHFVDELRREAASDLPEV